MNNWKVIFASLVIFGAGVVTGGLLVNFVEHSHPRNPHRPPALAAEIAPASNAVPPRAAEPARQRQPEILSKDFVMQLNEALALEPDQRTAIQKIIPEGQAQMRKSIQDARQQVLMEVHHQICEQLSASQQKKFEDLLKQYRSTRKTAVTTNAPAASPGTGSP